jgi:hypothetical protein
MGVGEDFRKFCDELVVRKRDSIAQRAGLITRRLNLAYWDTDSHASHSFYTGSFGRGTAIGLTSDVDMLMRLPYEVYQRFNDYRTNGQAALLQEVRAHIIKTYPVTNIGSDGCVVAVPFDDGITIEVLPAFSNSDESFTFPDSREGGKWKTTSPKPEIDEIASMDGKTNGNLKNLCKMARAWKATWDVPIGGLLIDTLAYSFIRSWIYRDKSYLYYDLMSRDFFEHLVAQDENQTYWLSPGASQYVWKTGPFNYKAKRARNMSIEAIGFAQKGHDWSARQKWREIYGYSYPA